MWGTSVGGEETLTSNKALPEKAYPSQLEKNGEEKVKLTFKNGEFVAIEFYRYDSPEKQYSEVK